MTEPPIRSVQDTAFHEKYETWAGVASILGCVRRLRKGGMFAAMEPMWNIRSYPDTDNRSYLMVCVMAAMYAYARGAHYVLEVKQKGKSLSMEPMKSFIQGFHNVGYTIQSHMGAFGHPSHRPFRVFASFDLSKFIGATSADSKRKKGMCTTSEYNESGFTEHTSFISKAYCDAYISIRLPEINIISSSEDSIWIRCSTSLPAL